jgi:hypothetical protein
MTKKITRRKFIEGSTKMAAGLSLGNMTSKLFGSNNKGKDSGLFVTIPMPIQLVIDDVGWWSGEDGHQRQEPYRTGINRNHVPADYQAIVDLGKALNIRPQAAMVLCEWDTDNILERLPTSTWMGTDWDNNKWIGPWLEEATEIIRDNKDHFEFTIHGIGHEYWTEGKFTRAEWADKNGIMRDREQVEAHLDFYEKLMAQNNLGPFPTSFVPTAFLHSFGVSEGHTVSMAQVLKRRGVNYINTPFEDMFHSDRVTHGLFGFDDEVMTVNRGRDLLSWKSIGKLPEGELHGPTCGLHWPNILHPDPELNGEIVNGWVEFLKPYQNKMETLLAENSEIFRHQLAHNHSTNLRVADNHINLDFSGIDKLDSSVGQTDITIKVQCQSELIFKSDNLRIESQSIINHESNVVYTLRMTRSPEKKEARLYYESKL